jgi:hypothetical protein
VSWRTTGILFLVLLIIGAAVLALQQRYSAGAQATPTPAGPFVEVVDLFDGVLVEDVVRLEIVRAEPEDEAVFAREEDSSWVQTVPTTTQVFSPTLTNQITGLLNTRARRSFSAEGGDLAPYGLDDPQASIVLAVRRAAEVVRFELALGNHDANGRRLLRAAARRPARPPALDGCPRRRAWPAGPRPAARARSRRALMPSDPCALENRQGSRPLVACNPTCLL